MTQSRRVPLRRTAILTLLLASLLRPQTVAEDLLVSTEHPLDNLSPAELFARVETWKARFAGGIQ